MIRIGFKRLAYGKYPNNTTQAVGDITCIPYFLRPLFMFGRRL
jgi:hypothetical protein